MASTLQNIITAIRAANIVPSTKVNYGFSDSTAPPYISVMDYEHTLTYDTSGAVLKDASYLVVVVDQSQDAAETLAASLDAVINNNRTLTANTIGSFQESYKVGQMGEKLYQFGVEIKYSLQENV
jgi:hypothetical protein